MDHPECKKDHLDAEDALGELRRIVASADNSFNRSLFKTCEIRLDEVRHNKEDGSLYWPFVATDTICNHRGTLHGGSASTLIDALSSLHARAVLPGDHATVDLHLSFLRAMPRGTKGVVRTSIVKAGKTMLFLRGDVTSPDGSLVYVLGTHAKAMLTKPLSTPPRSRL